MVSLYNEDCLEGMKRIPDGTVDMILTDLPYEITACAFDVRIPFEPMWEQFKRVTKRNAAIVLFAISKFTIELAASNLAMFRYEWIWEKSIGVGFLHANQMPLRCHENILVFYRQLPTYNPQFTQGKVRNFRNFRGLTLNYYNKKETDYKQDGEHYYPRDVIYYPSTVGRVERYHPQQKPVDLLEYLIKTYTNAGETVLDATMGSGSTGVAAVNTGRDFVGFELEKNFYDIACRRIAEVQAKQEQNLFKDVAV